MTTINVDIKSIQEFRDRMDLLGQKADEFTQKAVFRAINGTPRTEMIRRLPVATNSRYNHRWSKDGKDLGPKKRGARGTGAINHMQTTFKVEIKGTDEIRVGATAPYSGYVHDAKKPIEGDYWKPGQRHGWSRPGSGNKFISGPLERHAEDIPEWAVRQLDKMMGEAGIF